MNFSPGKETLLLNVTYVKVGESRIKYLPFRPRLFLVLGFGPRLFQGGVFHGNLSKQFFVKNSINNNSIPKLKKKYSSYSYYELEINWSISHNNRFNRLLL